MADLDTPNNLALRFAPEQAATVPAPIAGGSLIGADPQRVALLVANPSASQVVIWPALNVPANGGIPIAPGTVLNLTVKDYGPFITRLWSIKGAAAVNVSVISTSQLAVPNT